MMTRQYMHAIGMSAREIEISTSPCPVNFLFFFFFKQKTAYEIGLGIPAEPLFRSCLIQLTKLGYDATPFNQILKQNAKREMRLRLGKVTVADVLAAQPVTTNLLKFMRA